MRLDGKPTRVAWLQSREIDGKPLLAVMVEDAPGRAVVAMASAGGFPLLQGPWPDGEPAWGTVGIGAAGERAAAATTIDATDFTFTTRGSA